MRDTDDACTADDASGKEVSVHEPVQSRKDTCIDGSDLVLTEANTVLDLEFPREKRKSKRKHRNKNLEASSDNQGKAILTKSSSAKSADLPNELEAVKDAKVDQNNCDSTQPEPRDPLDLGCCQKKGKRKKKKRMRELQQDVQCTTSLIEDRPVEESLDLAVDGSTTSEQYHPDLNSGVPASNEEKCSKELLCCDTERKKKSKRKKRKRTQEDPDDFQGDAAEGTCDKVGAVSDMRTDQHPVELTHSCDSTNTKGEAKLGLESPKEERKRKKKMRQTTQNTIGDFQGDASMNEASYVEEGSVNEMRVDRKTTENQDASQLDSFKMDCDKSVSVNKTLLMVDTSLIENHASSASSGLVGSEDAITYKRRERMSLPCQKLPGPLEAIAEPSLMMTGEPGFDHSSDIYSSVSGESKLDSYQAGNCASTVDGKGVLAEKIASGCSNNDFVPSENEKASGIKKDVDVELRKKSATQSSSKAPEKACELQVIKSSCTEKNMGNALGVGKITMNDHHLPDSGSTENRSRILVLGIKNPLGNTSLMSDHKCDGNAGHVTVQSSSIETYKRKKSRSECGNTPVVIVKASPRPSFEVESSGLTESRPQSSEVGNDINVVEVQASTLAEKTIRDCSHSDLAIKESKEAVETVNVVGRSVRPPAFHPNKKLLVLDINGLLADIVPGFPEGYRCDLTVSNKSVFRRPFCSDFLYFCFEKFNVGVWSSRAKKNMDKIIPFVFRSYMPKLLFCWNAYHCTMTGFSTVERSGKPLMLKELKKLWENQYSDLPWTKGVFNETNTLLLDDSPYKALRNPVDTAIFPSPYKFRNDDDSSLGPGGDLREYLEGLADAENVQDYVSKHPFGQKAITDSNASWGFYSKIIGNESSCPKEVASSSQLGRVKPEE